MTPGRAGGDSFSGTMAPMLRVCASELRIKLDRPELTLSLEGFESPVICKAAPARRRPGRWPCEIWLLPDCPLKMQGKRRGSDMAATALDIVSVDLIKRELRIPDGVTSQDAMLERQIESSVSYIQHSLRAPLVDVVDTYRIEPVTGMRPLIFAAPALKEVERLSYWTPAGSEIDNPDGALLPASLGRLSIASHDWQTHSLYPPSERLAGNAGRHRALDYRPARDRHQPGNGCTAAGNDLVGPKSL